MKVEVVLSDSERALLYHMVNHQVNPTPAESSDDAAAVATATASATATATAAPKWNSSEILAAIPAEKKQVISSLEDLLKLLDDLLAYVDGVVDGKQKAFADVGMAISDILGNLETISAEEILSLYRDKVQDLLMASFVSTLTKTQAHLAGKLNSIL